MSTVNWQAVARNVASISPEALEVFNRQVSAHTTDVPSCEEPLEGLTRRTLLHYVTAEEKLRPLLPDGVLALLTLQEAELQALRSDVLALQNRVAGLPI